MQKMYKGNPPDETDGWKNIYSCELKDKTKWNIFVRDQDHTHDWKTYKVVADGRAMNKANYWLARNIETGQIGFGRDFVHMKTRRPQLHAVMEKLFEKQTEDWYAA